MCHTMLAADFHANYHSSGCSQTSSTSSSSAAAAAVNMTSAMTTTAASAVTSAVSDGTTSVVDSRGGGVCGVVSVLAGSTECRRESSLLFLLLVLGTVWLGLSLYNFTKTSVKRFIN